jgi:hypothetical protein
MFILFVCDKMAHEHLKEHKKCLQLYDAVAKELSVCAFQKCNHWDFQVVYKMKTR